MKLLLLCAVLPLALANQCTRSQFWSSELNACLSCTKCAKNQIQTRPCNSHRDTECTTISRTGLEFPWLDKEKENDIFELVDDDEPAKKGKKDKNHHVLKLSNGDDDDDDIYQDFLHSHHDKSHKKHNNKKHHYKFKQRINDKMLRFDDETTRKPHRNHFFVNPLKNFQPEKRHFTFPSELDLASENPKRKAEKRGKSLHDKSGSKRKNRLHSDDEEKLEEWLLMSEQELAKRKEDLLKNIKKDEFEEEKETNQKIKLNYPLYNTESQILDSAVSRNSIETKKKQKSIVDDEEDIFKELVKDNAESKLEIETLMSNRKDSQYRSETANRHMFMGEPSTISEIIGQTKDGQDDEIFKEDDKVIHYEKSKLSLMPVDDNSVEAVPFTAVETFVWDWQAVAFASAVTACLLFFMVVIVYSLVNNTGHAAHRRSKNACYTADMEEMSTRIALMQPTLEANIEGIHIPKLPTPPKI
ncbi:TNFR/NGFR cysteine-rich region [Nesidiocoris tenuis]|uniref:TNFR/NGFR cysteine-rich region n=1 Tax=Nesidiocoris tenuis TaxID=355587 RepID=A0ABN7B4R4_9HEMI|nr:TNFR/NGFR cysteine-rich region [Nesidiocoris tenuis]